MVEGENNRAPGADDRFQESSEALSQFVAHVLNQLSLSAWLPSAVLVLALTFIFQLGAVLDSKAKPESPDAATIRLLEGYWGTSRAMEWIAKLGCVHFQKKVQRLQKH